MNPILGTTTMTQVAIVVKDIEKTKDKWAQFLGMEQAPPTVHSGDDPAIVQAVYKGQPAPKAKCKMAFFQFGQVEMELIEPNGEPSTWQDFLDEKGEGIHHIAFGVKNTDEKLAAAEKIGMPVVQRGKYGDGNGEYAYLDSYGDLKCIVETLESY